MKSANIRLCLLAIALTGGAPLLAFAAPPGGSQAGGSAGNGTATTFNSSMSVDAADNTDYQLGGQVAVSDTTSYNFLYEYTNSPAASLDLLTHTYGVGVDQGIVKDVGFGLSYQRWGNPNEIISDNLYAHLYVQTPNFEVTALPGLRQISINARSFRFKNLLFIGDTIDTTDYPLGLRVDFTGLNDWLFEVSTTRHDYTHEPTFLNKKDSLVFFTGSVLTISQGFLDHSATARIEKDFDLSSLAIDYEIDRSAIDGTYAYTSDVDFTAPISDSFDMEIITGATHADKTPLTGFITLNFTYYYK